MIENASQITPDENVNIEVEVENIQSGDDPVAYYVTSKGPNGDQIMITIFESDRPKEAIQEGKRYKIESGVGELWDGKTPAIKTTSSTKINKISNTNQEDKNGKPSKNASLNNEPEDTVGNKIFNGKVVNIVLKIRDIYYKENSTVDFVAWGRDTYGEKVAVTIFEDDQLSTQLTEGEWYEFQNVRSERWEDGTPGILLTSRSQIILKEKDPDPKENEHSKSPIIDKVLNEPQTPTARRWYEKPFFGVAISGLATSIAIIASLFAPDIGIIGSAAFVLLGGIFSFGAAYVSYYRPSTKIRQKREKIHIRLLLELLLLDYRKEINKSVDIKANVMKSNGSLLSRTSSKLSMYSYTDGYDQSEIELEYDIGQKEGSACRAYVYEEITVYDTEQQQEPAADLTAQQRALTEQVSSILSIPITVKSGHNNRVIGVLNLDSESTVEKTKFNSKEIQSLAIRYSDLISDVLR